MIVTNKLIKNVNFNIFTSNKGAICTETSNFIAACPRSNYVIRTLHDDVCRQGVLGV